MISLALEENQSYRKQKTCYICKKEFSIDDKKHYIKSDMILIKKI